LEEELAAGLVRLLQPEADRSISSTASTRRFSLRYGVAGRSLTAFAPAVVLAWLGVAQAGSAASSWVSFTTHPSWTLASDLARSALYAAFVLGAAIVLARSKVPRARNGSRMIVASSLTASFLMLGVSFLPTGPILWSASNHVVAAGLAITVFGAALVFASFVSLGSNFSIVPEARALVVTGPYRFLRHPIYLAELLMIAGVAIGQLRVTTLVGIVGLLGLQIYRIRAEERLLRDAFPTTFTQFTVRTRFRLIPLLW